MRQRDDAAPARQALRAAQPDEVVVGCRDRGSIRTCRSPSPRPQSSRQPLRQCRRSTRQGSAPDRTGCASARRAKRSLVIPAASSWRLVLPMMTTPAARRRVTWKASRSGEEAGERDRAAGRRQVRGLEVVLDDDGNAVERTARTRCAAVRRRVRRRLPALAGSTRSSRSAGGRRGRRPRMRARYSSTSCREVTSPAVMAACSSAIDFSRTLYRGRAAWMRISAERQRHDDAGNVAPHRALDQALIFSERKLSGTAPSSSTRSWNALIAKRDPMAVCASWRDRRICRAPSMYAVACPG